MPILGGEPVELAGREFRAFIHKRAAGRVRPAVLRVGADAESVICV